MTLEQFRMLAADARAAVVFKTAPVAVFSGRGLTLTVEADLEDALPLEITAALADAAHRTGGK